MGRGRPGYTDLPSGIEAAKDEITDFVTGLETFDEWEPSERVRIKLIAPGSARRVLHNVRYLGDVYGMPIEAIEARLREDPEGHTHLTVDRLLPLPGQEEFDLIRRVQAERQSVENKARAQRPSALKLLLQHGLVQEGTTLYILPHGASERGSSPLRRRLAHIPRDLRQGVGWPTRAADVARRGTHEFAPSALPWTIDVTLCGDEGDEYGSPVAKHFSLTPGGRDLRQELVERGLR